LREGGSRCRRGNFPYPFGGAGLTKKHMRRKKKERDKAKEVGRHVKDERTARSKLFFPGVFAMRGGGDNKKMGER